MVKRRIHALLPVLLFCAANSIPVAGGKAALAVKAAYLVRFAAYVVWPPEQLGSEAPLMLCVIGNDPFGPLLDEAAIGQSVDGRPIRLVRAAAITPRSRCHIAYIAGSAVQRKDSALALLRGTPVLTVTDSAQDEAHGVIDFQIVRQRVGFRVDRAAAEDGGLSISARLLELALSVRQGSGK